MPTIKTLAQAKTAFDDAWKAQSAAGDDHPTSTAEIDLDGLHEFIHGEDQDIGVNGANDKALAEHIEQVLPPDASRDTPMVALGHWIPVAWEDPDGERPTGGTSRPTTFAEICSVLRAAAPTGRRVRAAGNGYDFGHAGETDGFRMLLGNHFENLAHEGLFASVGSAGPPDCVRIPYDPAEYFRFASGMTIGSINRHLAAMKPPRALLAQPGCAELTFVGVMTSGGQGAGTREDLGALSNSVRSIEILGFVDGRCALRRIEPDHGITDPELFKATYPSRPDLTYELIPDTALFHACTVSMGALGVITSITVETRLAFNIEENRTRTTWAAAAKRLENDLGDSSLHSLELWVNPYPRDGERYCVHSTRKETPATSGPGKRGLAIVDGSPLAYRALAAFMTALPRLTPWCLSEGLRLTLNRGGKVVLPSPQGLDFGKPNLAPVLAAGLALPCDDVDELVRMVTDIFEWVDNHARLGLGWVTSPMGLRFVGPADATLSPAFGRRTALLELVAFRATPHAIRTIEAGVTFALEKFADRGLRVHWGLRSTMDDEQMGRAYPAASLAAFKAAQARLGSSPMFDNKLTGDLGLSPPPSGTPTVKAHIYRSYGGLFADGHAAAVVPVPQTRSELWSSLCAALLHHRSIALHAGGSSLDRQALSANGDYVNMTRLDGVTFADPPTSVAAEAGATWQKVFQSSRLRGMMPKVVVTTKRATVGGTLSTNAITQASRHYGHEIDSVSWVDVYYPPSSPTEPWPVAPIRLQRGDPRFAAVIGGFGVVAIIVRAGYELVPVAKNAKAVTRVLAHGSLQAALEALKGDPTDARRRALGVLATEKGWSHFLLETRIASGEKGKPFLAYEGRTSILRMASELLISTFAGCATASHASASACAGYAKDEKQFVNELEDYVFLMEPNRVFKDTWLGRHALEGVPTIQQTFVLPDATAAATFIVRVQDLCASSHPSAAGAVWASQLTASADAVTLTAEEAAPLAEVEVRLAKMDKHLDDGTFATLTGFAETRGFNGAEDKLARRFLARAAKMKRFVPAMLDVVYLPKDEALLSATHDGDGFAVTLAFQDPALNERSWIYQHVPQLAALGDAVKAMFRELAQICVTLRGADGRSGRLHLTKTVLVPSAGGEAGERKFVCDMLGSRLADFNKVRETTDKGRVLSTSFSKRFLGI